MATSVSANRKRASQHLAIGVYILNKQNITCPLVDTNFIFSFSTRYLTCSLRSLVRYRVEHSKIKFVSTCGHVISSIYCMAARRCEISLRVRDHLWNIFQNSKRNFVSPRGHVISSICFTDKYLIGGRGRPFWKIFSTAPKYIECVRIRLYNIARVPILFKSYSELLWKIIFICARPCVNKDDVFSCVYVIRIFVYFSLLSFQ